ncbi:hypothetical protein N7456_008402 [Penicillium angulare]|uniref:Uncharacterized protein n=1 Tax=Penicillium angulare TaxID=116970 RepID=A0A9W9K9M3_9EURO|nr:hypothetical protein N7456_008402 [Penicillium angulare]
MDMLEDLGFRSLERAAQRVSDILWAARISSTFIGGYAASLLTGNNNTKKVEIVVSRPDYLVAMSQLQSGPEFHVEEEEVWYHDGSKLIPIELMQSTRCLTMDLRFPPTGAQVYRLTDLRSEPPLPSAIRLY